MGADLAALPGVDVMLAVHAIGGGVLQITSSSFTPASTSFSASRSTAWAGRLTQRPRMSGMMQNLHLWLQPSEIFR